MKHSANTFLLLTAAGCGTSNAVITGLPVGGQSGPPATGSIVSSSMIQPVPPTAALHASAGVGGAAPALISASAGTAAVTSGSIAVAPSGNSCRQAKYSLAVRLTVDMSWDETVALMAGADKLYFWSKLTIEPSTRTISEFRSCGTLAPVFHGTALAGNSKSFQSVPLAKYDLPSMPSAAGGLAMQNESLLTLLPGPLVVGLRLPDPAGPWPQSSGDPSALPVDADGDGKPGVTSLMRNDAMFASAPTSILQTERIDATYVANRVAFRATLNDSACSDTFAGTAELMAMDQLLLGCHVQNRDDCRSEEFSFIADNRPQIRFGASAVADAVVLPNDASCAQAVQVLEVPGP